MVGDFEVFDIVKAAGGKTDELALDGGSAGA